ncbi:MAG: hypothetical protein DHS20C01_19490 [marine bacterium B5-7]|nr:MAG: hypothetical protein DHS20C01_19490 [marine bacterium B5-7]
MSEKQQIIAEMIQLQKTFIDYEHQNGVDPSDYFNPEAGHTLDGFRQKYQELANRLVDMAHEEKGSRR